jgi:hypothetical protein
MDTERSSETGSVTSPVRVSKPGEDTGAGITASKVFTGWWAYPRAHGNAVNETTCELCAERQEKVNATTESKL